MNKSGAIKQQLVIGALILGLWFLLVTAFSGALVFWRSIPWPEAMRLSFLNWYPWVLLGPAAVWLAFRFPIEKPGWPVSLPLHLAASLLSVYVSAQLVGPPLCPRDHPGWRSRAGPRCGRMILAASCHRPIRIQTGPNRAARTGCKVRGTDPRRANHATVLCFTPRCISPFTGSL